MGLHGFVSLLCLSSKGGAWVMTHTYKVCLLHRNLCIGILVWMDVCVYACHEFLG